MLWTLMDGARMRPKVSSHCGLMKIHKLDLEMSIATDRFMKQLHG